MDALAEAVHDYIDSRKWSSLVGRAYDMYEKESRDAFADFLTTHIRGLLKHMDSDKIDTD